ncbi:gamma-glutamyl-gamma-aminobutyrate hydrolase family protein [Salinisphaera sp.]|uniref:gamma-glutamyl-gamma-aminobutyrate hydrolase family protein n=1 Tax=Salinisphaera sp. TaxID=1914330 RepID=UPI000C3DF7AA|nr:gamma-glutamyl-gamma-aminobutyrate hydrolase family protein [Salinisphaera sp.]MBS63313.1 peptidase C26 [Salinisphaera sp.]
MRRARPIIAVTGKASRWAPGWWAAWLAIALAGGRAVRATPRHPMPTPIDGLLIGGGDDIATDLYGASAAYDNTADRARDAFELAGIKQALAENKPVLGICRGAQLINVAAGGTLYSDISKLRQATSNRVNVLSCKPIAIKRRSRLAAIFGRRRLRVNSLHHQAVLALGEGIGATARDADGFVQAIEAPKYDFVIGVQWHPEYLCYQGSQRRLFRALVAACRRRRDAGTEALQAERRA